MPHKVVNLAVALSVAIASAGALLKPFDYKLASAPQTQPATPATQSWPNLDKLRIPDGKLCGLDGAPGGNAERAAQNRLRNRYHLPQTSFEQLSLENLEKDLPQGEIGPAQTIINFPLSVDRNNQRAVAVVGYVTDVLILGCGAADERFTQVPPPERKGVESAGCYVNREYLCTAQITLTSDPELPTSEGRNVYFVNVTRRSRILAKKNLLVSNIGNDWSTYILRDKIKHRWVRFSGWLFFNQNYRDRAWVTDPDDQIGRPNDRQTAWGIFPVMGIEVVDGPKVP